MNTTKLSVLFLLLFSTSVCLAGFGGSRSGGSFGGSRSSFGGSRSSFGGSRSYSAPAVRSGGYSFGGARSSQSGPATITRPAQKIAPAPVAPAAPNVVHRETVIHHNNGGGGSGIGTGFASGLVGGMVAGSLMNNHPTTVVVPQGGVVPVGGGVVGGGVVGDTVMAPSVMAPAVMVERHGFFYYLMWFCFIGLGIWVVGRVIQLGNKV